MKRQPWFWPVKRFIKRISGKEPWLKKEAAREVLETGGWIYILELLMSDSVVYSLGIGKQRTASSIEHLRKLGYGIFAISETGRELGFVLKSDG